MSSERKAGGRPRPHVLPWLRVRRPSADTVSDKWGRIVVGPRSHERDTDFLKSGTLKIRKKLCRRCLIGEGLFARKVGNDLLYKRTTFFEHGNSRGLI
jgi:hypothetical protein